MGPLEGVFTKTGRLWLSEIELRPVQREIVDRYLYILDVLDEHLGDIKSEVERKAKESPQAVLLKTIPGIGSLTALLFLAEVGDIDRFPDARSLVSFAGLAPRVRSSGGKTHMGRITKQGSRWLRFMYTEAASVAARFSEHLGGFHRRIQKRHGTQTANIALARKLVTISYFVLKRGVPYEIPG